MGERKHQLDALRVGVFGLLILYHVGMLYVPWPYNLHSPRPIPALEWPMDALSPWRMALLFVISGVASRALVEKLGPGRFALERTLRLLPPILTGMLIIIPAQTYVELVAKIGLKGSYPAFWLGPYLHADQSLVRPLHKTMPTWDHLWFVVYLLNFALLAALILAVWRPRAHRPDLGPPLWTRLVLPAVWMAASNIVIQTAAPFTHAFFDDWAADLKWAGLYFVGWKLLEGDDVWIWLGEQWPWLASAALLLLAVQLGAKAVAPLEYSGQPLWQVMVWAISDGLFGWSGVLAALGLATRFLNKTLASLTWLNRAVLPVYVLHQPVMLVAAFLVFPLHWPLMVEVLFLVAITGAGSTAAYACLIRPFPPMRFLFGDRSRRSEALKLRAPPGPGETLGPYLKV